ncbi:hypothetical protein O4H25_11765 [Staphylococcus equorum]|uniref:LEM-3-like GIY-YIG domain-containing protein n=1 Tax=Staphylococcus equorum TaxID=246432 RepID=UPI0022AEEDC5|nr:hypothetical protein [Staphylococcus equorum]MCZ4237535.1 hypothetical protein [Staphylococcus equorum]
MKHINQFSESTLAHMEQDHQHVFYVYCLIDPRNGECFYVGKGKGNRVFKHKEDAQKHLLYEDIYKEENKNNLKFNKINEICSNDTNVLGYIISYGLTESEAFSAENVLINFLNLTNKTTLTNMINGHGSKAYLVEDLENEFGYDSINLENINTNELILAVKIRDAFRLDKDESKEYPIKESERDRSNLKSRTLGSWIIGKDKIHKIKYIIGINTGANNAVVSAYEVSYEQVESAETDSGRIRYSFIALSERDATLKNLNLYKKALPNLKFGRGSATAYINSYN